MFLPFIRKFPKLHSMHNRCSISTHPSDNNSSAPQRSASVSASVHRSSMNVHEHSRFQGEGGASHSSAVFNHEPETRNQKLIASPRPQPLTLNLEPLNRSSQHALTRSRTLLHPKKNLFSAPAPFSQKICANLRSSVDNLVRKGSNQ